MASSSKEAKQRDSKARQLLQNWFETLFLTLLLLGFAGATALSASPFP